LKFPETSKNAPPVRFAQDAKYPRKIAKAVFSAVTANNDLFFFANLAVQTKASRLVAALAPNKKGQVPMISAPGLFSETSPEGSLTWPSRGETR
jgi:hypothetical protein